MNFTQELRCGLNSKEREPQEDLTEYISKEFVRKKRMLLQRKKLKETYDMNMNLLSPQDHKFPSLVAKVALKSKRKLIDNL